MTLIITVTPLAGHRDVGQTDRGVEQVSREACPQGVTSRNYCLSVTLTPAVLCAVHTVPFTTTDRQEVRLDYCNVLLTGHHAHTRNDLPTCCFRSRLFK